MAGVVAGLITSAVVKIASDKLSSAIAEQAGLVWNFKKDLEDMKDTMESMAAVLKDAEKQSVTKESVRLWLKRLKHAALDISDMTDDYHDTARSTVSPPSESEAHTAPRTPPPPARAPTASRSPVEELPPLSRTPSRPRSTEPRERRPPSRRRRAGLRRGSPRPPA